MDANIANTKNLKRLAIIGGGIIVSLGLVLAGKRVYEFFYKEDSAEQMKNVIDNLIINTKDLSITDQDAELIALSLLEAMNQYGTDENAIMQLLAPLNQADLLLVIQKFNVKPYNGVGLSTTWIDLNMFSLDLTLSGWLKAELRGKELEFVRGLFEKNGIPF